MEENDKNMEPRENLNENSNEESKKGIKIPAKTFKIARKIYQSC